MKRTLLACLLFLPALLLAQTPDCPAQTFTLTADGNVGGASGYYKNIPTGCTLWYVSYQSTAGITGWTLALQAAKGTITPGSFSTVTPSSTSPSYGTAVDGMATYNFVSSTSGSNVVAPFLRVNVAGSSGVGSIQIQMWGYRAGYSAMGSGGSGGGGTVTSVAAGCSLAGGPITTTGTLSQAEPVNVQTGTSYIFASSDCGKLVSQSNAGAIADTLPVATTSGFGAGFFFDVQNTGAGTITLTPTTSTIDGASSITLATNQGVRIASNGTNYFTQRGLGATSAGGVTSVGSGCSLAGGTITTTGTLSQAEPVNVQTGTSYTFLSSDCGKLITQSNAGAIADTLPVATTSGFGAGFFFDVQNTGAGTITLTPTTSTIDGASSITLATNQGVRIATDGMNYFTQRGLSSGGGGCVAAGVYITCINNRGGMTSYGPLQVSGIPPLAASWTNAGNVTTLTDITGGGLAYTSNTAGLPGGWTLPAPGLTNTFVVTYSGQAITAGGFLGIFCTAGGSSLLMHWDNGSISVSAWTGMTTTSPTFILSLASASLATFPPVFEIQNTGANYIFSYATAPGQPFTTLYNQSVVGTFSVCGIEGGGTGSVASSANVVSVVNTSP